MWGLLLQLVLLGFPAQVLECSRAGMNTPSQRLTCPLQVRADIHVTCKQGLFLCVGTCHQDPTFSIHTYCSIKKWKYAVIQLSLGSFKYWRFPKFWQSWLWGLVLPRESWGLRADYSVCLLTSFLGNVSLNPVPYLLVWGFLAPAEDLLSFESRKLVSRTSLTSPVLWCLTEMWYCLIVNATNESGF